MNRLLTTLYLALVIAVPGSAQTITASLEGIVRDPSGGVIPGLAPASSTRGPMPPSR